MTSAWTANGPVSLPPKSVAYGAGVVVAALALIGLGLGFSQGWRGGGSPDLSGARTSEDDGTLAARPIVELPPPVSAPEPAKAEEAKKDDASDEEKAKEIAAQAAAAQQIQAKPSKPAGNIDDILTSSSEKPPAVVKPPSDEAPPVKSDVPF